VRVGAVLAVAGRDEQEALSDFGLSLGRSLRILEDLHFWSDPANRAIFAAAERALTYPLLLLWEKEGREAWEGVRRELSDSPERSLSSLQIRLGRSGYLDASLLEARRQAESAAERIDVLAPTEARRLLQEVARTFLFDWQLTTDSCQLKKGR
jgi:geranylgeranyl pyrophosphate synthase